MRQARDLLGLSQDAAARSIGIERKTYSNYERAITPLRCETALRICKRWILSEEWLATGTFEVMQSAFIRRSPKFRIAYSLEKLDWFFIRQCMDLLSEPATKTIPVGLLFTKAYDEHLRELYSNLAIENWLRPRVVLDDPGVIETGSALLRASMDRWLRLLTNQIASKSQSDKQAILCVFVEGLIASGDQYYTEFRDEISNAEDATQRVTPEPSKQRSAKVGS